MEYGLYSEVHFRSWHNGEGIRKHGCEDPDCPVCSAAHSPLGLGGEAGADTTQLVVWSFLACQGRLEIPHQFLIESFGTASSGDPDSEGPNFLLGL